MLVMLMVYTRSYFESEILFLKIYKICQCYNASCNVISCLVYDIHENSWKVGYHEDAEESQLQCHFN